MPAALMSPRISSTASGAPGTNCVGPPSALLPPELEPVEPPAPPARTGTMLLSPNSFSS